MPFPTNFPTFAIPTVIGYLRGTGVGNRAAAEAAYDLLGYAGHLAIPQDGPLVLHASAESWGLLSDAALAARLEEFQADLDANPNAAFSVPPWLIPILLDVLRRLLVG